jgi:uncharacterized membrane protein
LPLAPPARGTPVRYGEGTQWLTRALEGGGYEVVHLPNHLASERFPTELTELQEFNLLILSDIGANTLLLHPDVIHHSKPVPNRLELIRSYVESGGGLLMIGGYMSFAGIDGRARYGGTPVEAALPVTIKGTDDRVEMPQGFKPRVLRKEHPAVVNLPEVLPMMLFYNEVTVKPEAELLLGHEGVPILAAWEYGDGRAAAFTPDAAPHGAPPEFLDWESFDRLWQQVANWLCRKEGDSRG